MGYGYGDLEPVLPAEIMEIHHSKHHATYVANYNAAIEKQAALIAADDVAGIIANQSAINFNGGGHVNHSIFWKNLAPPSQGGGAPPTGKLAKAIDARFGSFEEFKSRMSAATVGIQGSGWGWLCFHHETKDLEIVTCANQDPCLVGVPLLGIDVWEHAYYLQYKNVRPEYVKQLWSVVNFKDVAERYENALK